MSFRPTKVALGLVAGAVVLFGVGTNVQSGWVLVISAVLLGMAAAGAVLPLVALRGVEVAREAAPTARAGEAVVVTLSVRNASRGLRGLIGLHDDFCGQSWSVAGLLRPGQARRFTDVRREARRGVYRQGTVGIITGAPFGVVTARRALNVPTPIVVYPRIFPTRVPVTAGSSATDVRSPAGDTSGVREYRAGDELRHVHWRSTARRGEIVVREFTEQVRGDMVVIADCPDDPDVLDTVASAACSLALACLADGRAVRLRHCVGGQARSVTASSGATIDGWGARLTPDPLGVDAAVRLPASGTVVCVLAAEERNAATIAMLQKLPDVEAVIVDPRPAGSPATTIGSWFIQTLRAAGHGARLVPTTTDLGPWL